MLDVLLVEDDSEIRECIASSLEEAGHRVTQASDGGRAATLLESHAFDVAICDVYLPTINGLALARRAQHVAPEMDLLMMSSDPAAAASAPGAKGRVRYLVKPFDPDELVERVLRPIAERRALRRELQGARERWVNSGVGVRVVAASSRMRVLVERLALIAQSDASVLLHGERGTGKKTLARMIHEESSRRHGPFVLVPRAELSRLLAGGRDDAPEDEAARREGWFHAAEGGTLVLDGIDALPQSAQARLARLLAVPEGIARRGARWVPIGVRVISIAGPDPLAKLSAGKLLESLFFRVAAATAGVPALRERQEDLVPLVASILAGLASSWASPSWIEPSALAVLAAHPFHGNIAELAWALDRALATAGASPIDASHFPHRIAHGGEEERDETIESLV